MKKINLILSLFFLAVIWALLTFFTIARDLPSRYTPETDGITPKLNFSAKEMMKEDTYKYPPLQYILADSITKNTPEYSLSPEKLEEKRSQRIIIYRMLSAVMGLGTAIFLFLAGYLFLRLPPLYSLGASTFFLTLSPVLFYSQSSNMDMPACFWFTGSLFFSALAEYKFRKDGRKKAYVMTHLLVGLFIACAFCTKDQIYALYILPAMAFCYRRWKETNSLQKTLTLCLLWGGTFFLTCTLIYFLIGFEVVLPHFNWIMGEGSSPYAAAGKGIMERGKLLWYSLRDLGKALDLPFLASFPLLALMVCKKKDFYKKDAAFCILTVLSFLILLSQFLFFCQVVRYSQVRYFLPVLPILILLLTYIFKKEMEKTIRKKIFSGMILFLLFYQCAIGINFLYILHHSPLAQLKNDLTESLIYKNCSIHTLMAQMGERYWQKKDGSMEKRKCIRPWGIFLGLEKYGIKDIFPDDLSLFLLDPHILISNKKESFPEEIPYGLNKVYEKKSRFFFSLYEINENQKYFLYSKNENIKKNFFPLKDGFQKDPLEIQIVKLNHLLPMHKNFSFTEMSLVGKALAHFTPPDSNTFLIRNYMYRILFDAYSAAGRKEDAEKCRKFYSSLRQ